MPIHVYATCEAPTCTTACAFAFEYGIETFAHLVEALEGDGWAVVFSDAVTAGAGADLSRSLGLQRRTHTYCPLHRAMVASPIAVALEVRPGDRAARPLAFELSTGEVVDVRRAACAHEPKKGSGSP
jgi:hypothetical protein